MELKRFEVIKNGNVEEKFYKDNKQISKEEFYTLIDKEEDYCCPMCEAIEDTCVAIREAKDLGEAFDILCCFIDNISDNAEMIGYISALRDQGNMLLEAADEIERSLDGKEEIN